MHDTLACVAMFISIDLFESYHEIDTNDVVPLYLVYTLTQHGSPHSTFVSNCSMIISSSLTVARRTYRQCSLV